MRKECWLSSQWVKKIGFFKDQEFDNLFLTKIEEILILTPAVAAKNFFRMFLQMAFSKHRLRSKKSKIDTRRKKVSNFLTGDDFNIF